MEGDAGSALPLCPEPSALRVRTLVTARRTVGCVSVSRRIPRADDDNEPDSQPAHSPAPTPPNSHIGSLAIHRICQQ